MNPFDPMPTIQSILGMTMAQDIEQSIMLAQLDDFEAPECESFRHGTDLEHHSGSAGFLMLTPCHHDDGYRCVAFTKWMLALPGSHCEICKECCKPSELTFLPIGGQK